VVYKVQIQCYEDAKLIKLFAEITFQEQFKNDSRLEGLIKMADLKINLALIPLRGSIMKQQWPYACAKQWSYACGSDISFMSSTFAVKTTCKISKVEGAHVAAANGKLMMRDIACSNCSSSIQGHNFTSESRLIDIKGYDIILGADWIYMHRLVGLDLRKRDALTRATHSSYPWFHHGSHISFGVMQMTTDVLKTSQNSVFILRFCLTSLLQMIYGDIKANSLLDHLTT
jgi:hypothetical protein